MILTTAIRLSIYFGTSPEVWIGLQADYELRITRRILGTEVEKSIRRHAA